MKKSLMIGNDGNFVVSNHQWIFCSTLAEYTAQKIQIAIKKFVGEYFLDRKDDGIPFLTFMDKNVRIDIVDSAFKTAILNVAEVAALSKYTSTFNSATRTYDLYFVAQLSDNTSISMNEQLLLGGA